LEASRCPTYDGVRTNQAVGQFESSEEPRIQLFSFARSLKNNGGYSAGFGLLLNYFKFLPNLRLFLLPTVCLPLFFGLELCNSGLEGIFALIPKFLNLLQL
jgi:hypothetical protein